MIEYNPSEEVDLPHFEQDIEGPVHERKKGKGSLKYDMLGSVGEGAMGEIMLARDQELRRKVAFKKVHKQMSSNSTVMSRFFKEAQITAQLDHPNIVPIYSFDTDEEGNVGYSMKLIQGIDLKELIKESKTQVKSQEGCDEDHDLPALLDHFLKVCDAMHFAHIKGVIHRDLKPANIMIGPYNEVYVMDWGIAKVISQTEEEPKNEGIELRTTDSETSPLEETQMGSILGTPRYMSPQQAAGKNNELDGQSDQFTLGLILFELVTLKPAFRAKTQIEMIKKVLKVELEPMVHLQPKIKIPLELQAIISKATQKKTPPRYATVADMADDIRRYLKGEAVLAQPDTPIQKLMRWMNRNKELTLGLVFAIFILSASATIWSLYQKQQSLIQAQQHEKQLSQVLLKVGKKAQLIDGQFMNFESILNGIANSAAQLHEFGKQQETPFYTNPEFSPPDLKMSSYYNTPVSLNWNNFKLAPDIKKTDVKNILERISPLRFIYQQAFQKSVSQTFSHHDFLNKGGPLAWVYVGFEAGIHASYPGKTGYPAAYDPRLRPWYKQSLKQTEAQWKTPYIDVAGMGWLLPCTQVVRSSHGQLLGVAAVEMTLEYIQSQFLNLKDLKGFKDSYLLNVKGEIMVSTQDKKESFKFGTLINADKKLTVFPQSQVLTQMKSQTSGYLELSKEGILYAYYQIPSLGWYYVVEIDSKDK